MPHTNKYTSKFENAFRDTLANYIGNKLIACGYSACFVGGAVRDILLGHTPHDIDITTNATPEQVMECFSDMHVTLTGESFPVCRVDGIEVATFRKDIYTADNESFTLTSSIEEDLSRRDLTINAIAVDCHNLEITCVEGAIEDIENRLVKFVGDPYARIEEDPNRIIRALRFATGDGFILDLNTILAIQMSWPKVKDRIAKERIQVEIMKALSNYKTCSHFFKLLNYTHILKDLCPELARCYKHPHGLYHMEDVFEHNMLCGDALPCEMPLLKLAGYLHDIGKPVVYDGKHFYDHHNVGAEIVEAWMRDYHWSERDIKFVSGAIKCHMRTVMGKPDERMKPKTIRKALVAFEEAGISLEDFILLRIADHNANLSKTPMSAEEIKRLWSAFLTEAEQTPKTRKSLAINGHQIMSECGIEAGPCVGEIINTCWEFVLDNPDKNDYDSLMAVARGALKG